MRLSYYGGGHYDSVAPVDGRASSGMMLPPVDRVAAVAAGTAGEGVLGTAGGTAGAALPATPEPGQLEDAALERSRRRAAEAGSGRWVHVKQHDDHSRVEQRGAEASLCLRLRVCRVWGMRVVRRDWPTELISSPNPSVQQQRMRHARMFAGLRMWLSWASSRSVLQSLEC